MAHAGEEVDALVARMEDLLVPLRDRGDARQHFHATYLRTTKAVGTELAAGGFDDPVWVETWDIVFADLYLDALEADQRGAPVPGPWAVAFGAADKTKLAPLQHVLLGMNAHINYDLPQALLAVITDQEFDDKALVERREADHRHIDLVLSRRVDGEAREAMDGGQVRLVDRLLSPLNRLGTKRFLKEARAKVWANTTILAMARRVGEAAYTERLGELERLVSARVAALTRPGPVLLDLAVRGFGVQLRPRPANVIPLRTEEVS